MIQFWNKLLERRRAAPRPQLDQMRNNGRVEIVSGLKPGEQVVTAGHNKVDQGSRVVIDNSIALNRTDGSVIQ